MSSDAVIEKIVQLINTATAHEDYNSVFHLQKSLEVNVDDKELSQVLSTISQLSTMGMRSSDALSPFVPLLETQDGRSILPEDIQSDLYPILFEVAEKIDDNAVSARLLDSLWVASRDAAAARLAVSRYIQLADSLSSKDEDVDFVEALERSIRLSLLLNDSLVSESTRSRLLVFEEKFSHSSSHPYVYGKILELLDEVGLIESSTIYEKSKGFLELDDLSVGHGEHFANICLKAARRMGDGEKIDEACVLLSEIYEKQGRRFANSGSFMAAAHWMEKSYEALRGRAALKEKRSFLYRDLREFQKRAVSEFKEIRSPEIDISEIALLSMSLVSKDTFFESMMGWLRVASVQDFDELSRSAKELMQKHPLQNIFGQVQYSQEALIAARTEGAVSIADPDEEAIWPTVVQHSEIGRGISVQAQIMPALRKISLLHAPNDEQIGDLFKGHQFIPSDRRRVFTNMFRAALIGDWPTALSLMIPQFENFVRTILENLGCEVTELNKFGRQEQFTIGKMLSVYSQEFKEIFGKNAYQEARILLVDELGPDVRNRVAHGNMNDGEFFAPSSIYTFWFCSLLVLAPTLKRWEEGGSGSDQEGSAKPE